MPNVAAGYLSAEEAAELQEFLIGKPGVQNVELRSQELPDPTLPSDIEADFIVVPTVVWIVIASVIGAAGIAQIVIWIIQRLGCSAVIATGSDGKLDVTKDCDVKGLVILEDKDGKRTVVDQKLVDLNDIIKTAIESGIKAAADAAAKATPEVPANQ